MKDELDNLIRDARPQTHPGARRNAMAAAVAVVGEAQVSAMPWLRIAAVLVFAFVGGSAAELWLGGMASNQPLPAAERGLSATANELGALESRLAMLEAETVAASQAVLARANGLQQRLDSGAVVSIARIEAIVERRAQESAARRAEMFRERHLAYARRRYQADVERAVAALKAEHEISAQQEAEIRDVFAEHGRNVETLISRHYKGKCRHLPGEFEPLVEAVSERIQSIIADVPRHLPGTDLVDWGPNPEFRDVTDFDSWLRWNEEVQQVG